MNEFILDSRLANDCIILGKLDLSQLLLMNNSLFSWFILVPETDKTEIIDLPKADQARLLDEINFVSRFTRDNFTCTKLNIAAIGNIVSQLHIHIVGRNPDDICWPNVVWGVKDKKSYNNRQIEEIINSLTTQLGDRFSKFA